VTCHQGPLRTDGHRRAALEERLAYPGAYDLTVPRIRPPRATRHDRLAKSTVGYPVTLEAGAHVLGVRFRNGFGSNQNDQRHLFLARYELAGWINPGLRSWLTMLPETR